MGFEVPTRHNAKLSEIKTNPETVNEAVYLSQIAHHYERVADRTTNICEWVVFAVTGEMKELDGRGLDI